jgi:DegV family protein with EDD domain
MTVKIVTDSVADLPVQIADELGITIVPLHVRFGSDVYRDGVDLTAEQFYYRLKDSQTLPVTSVPAPADFATAYDKLSEETEEILVITLSAKLSGTYDVALQSAGLMKRQCRVEVIDSRLAVMAQGFVVIAAAKAANDGASLDEVVAVVHHNIPRADIQAAFNTLEYLKRGGRIGKAQALLGSVLKINPIVTLKDGVVFPVAREHSRARAINRLYDFVMSYSHIEGLAIEDAAVSNEAEVLAARLGAKFPREHIYRSKTTPVIGTHTGPGLLLVAVLGER